MHCDSIETVHKSRKLKISDMLLENRRSQITRKEKKKNNIATGYVSLAKRMMFFHLEIRSGSELKDRSTMNK